MLDGRRPLIVAFLLGVLTMTAVTQLTMTPKTSLGRRKATQERAFVLNVGLAFRSQGVADGFIKEWGKAADYCLANEDFLFAYELAQSDPELTRTPWGLRWVRTGYAYQPPKLGSTGGAGRLAPRAVRTVRTRYAYQPRACRTYRAPSRPRSDQDPLRYLITERYRSKADYLGAHRSSSAFKV
jgi:hypothetical protein